MPNNVPHQVIFKSVDTYIATAQEVNKEEFFALLCAAGIPYQCTYYLEYACFSCVRTNMYLGLIDCVANKYYVGKTLSREDISAAIKEPFIQFKLEKPNDSN